MLLNNKKKSLDSEMYLRMINDKIKLNGCFFLINCIKEKIEDGSDNIFLKLGKIFGYGKNYHSSRLFFNVKYVLNKGNLFLFFFEMVEFNSIFTKLQMENIIDNISAISVNGQLLNFFNINEVLGFNSFSILLNIFKIFFFLFVELYIRIFKLIFDFSLKC